MKKIILVILFLCCAGCKEYRPPSNTPEHKAAHGFIEGEVTELWVGETLLRIPPDVHFNPVTSGKITKGRAEEVGFGLRYPQYESSHTVNGVRISLRGHGYENPEMWDKNFREKKWKSSEKKPKLGLEEYKIDSDQQGWGYITYIPIDSSIKTPKGSLIRYRCAGNQYDITFCLSGFTLVEDLYVQYKVSKQLLPHWLEIHNDVIEYVEKLIVK